MSTEERIIRLEDAFTQLHTMTRNLDSRTDDHLNWINELGTRTAELVEVQANTERKIAALVDAQIRTEDALAQLTAKMSALADAQAHTDETVTVLASKVDALTDLVRDKG